MKSKEKVCENRDKKPNVEHPTHTTPPFHPHSFTVRKHTFEEPFKTNNSTWFSAASGYLSVSKEDLTAAELAPSCMTAAYSACMDD